MLDHHSDFDLTKDSPQQIDLDSISLHKLFQAGCLLVK